MINRNITSRFYNSFFLFGARGTGKSTWLKQEFLQNRPHLFIDLLDQNQEEIFAKDPGRLLAQVEKRSHENQWVVIDEVQKVAK